MEKTNFDLLLERYLKGDVSEQERNKIEAWLATNKNIHGKEFTWAKSDEEILFQKISRTVDNTDEVIEYRPAAKSRLLLNTMWLKVAASILLLVIAGVFTKDLFFNNTSSVTAKNDVEKTILADGTIVWLQKSSTLEYSEDKAGRYAALTGEGLFEVAKNAALPFTITSGKITATVVGTSFTLKTGVDQIELNVLTGKVHLSAPGNSRGIDVVPNGKVIFSAEGDVQHMSIPEKEKIAIKANPEYTMQFAEAIMETVLARIEKKFDVTVSVDNKSIYRCGMTADLTDQSLETSLKILSEVHDFDYTIQGKAVVISGEGCD